MFSMFMWAHGRGAGVLGRMEGRGMSNVPWVQERFPLIGIPLYLKPSLNYSFAQIQNYCIIFIE